MVICGLQHITLLDYPGKVACSVFLGGCNFRCCFCHNTRLLDNFRQFMTERDLFDYLNKRKGILEGVVITGGEPCMNYQLPEFLRKIKDCGLPVKLDTNGYYPEMLRKLIDEKLVDYIAMDIKNSPEKYAMTVGVFMDTGTINDSINIIKNTADYEFRTTVVDELHTKEDFELIGEWIEKCKRYSLQSFVDRQSVMFAGLHGPTLEKLESYVEVLRPHAEKVMVRAI